MINVKNLLLGIGIVIVFGLVLWQGTEVFYPSPDYAKFCNYNYAKTVPVINPGTDVRCTFSLPLQEQQNQCYEKGGQPIFTYDTNGCALTVESCDMCQKELEKALDKHSWGVFIISIVVGIIALFVGFSILSIEPVGSALIGSGIWAIFWGSLINWRNFGTVWRFILLFIALVALIYITIRLNKAKHEKQDKPRISINFGLAKSKKKRK